MNTFSRLMAGVLAAALLSGCGGPTKYSTAGIAAAQGADVEIQVEKAEGSYDVALEVHHLLPPERVVADARFYIVWVRAGDRPAVQLATLQYDAEKRSGSAQASTIYGTFQLFVTAEKLDQPVAPGTDVVIKQAVAVE